MQVMSNCIPVAAVVLGQLDAGDVSKLSVYGPLGIICLWLIWRDERQLKSTAKISEGQREDNSKLREEVRGVVHQMKGLNRNLLYITATHGPPGLREVANKELERSNEKTE